MSKLNPSTERVATAAIYREAARLIECGEKDHSAGACCIAYDVAEQRGIVTGTADDFYDFFKPLEGSNPLWWGKYWGEEAEACRILSLCFMAAMVEAGDA